MIRRSEENVVGTIGIAKNIPEGLHGKGTGKLSTAAGPNNRRALSNIDRNIIGAPPFACANKRALPERQEVAHKNPPAHRPITRKFAAEFVNNNVQKESTRHHSETEMKEGSDCTLTDAEKYHDTTREFSPPMFVQHTEAMMEEIDRMEVEMEDVTEERIVNIDNCDMKNPLAVVEYIDDLYSFYKKEEMSSCVPANYMDQQVDINERMRGILIDWLIEVHYKFELMEETLYLTVNLIDRFLAAHQVVRKKLQLVGVTALLLACKYEEVLVPVVEDLILISDRAYSRKEVLEMERLMVNVLQFSLSVPTPYVFMRRYLKAAQSDRKLELLSFFMIELCLVEYEMLKFPPSLLAAAAIYTSQCTLTGNNQWTKTNEWYSSYTVEQLQECSRHMVNFHRNAATGKLTGVHRKYSTTKFGHAAKIEPANFLLEFRF